MYFPTTWSMVDWWATFSFFGILWYILDLGWWLILGYVYNYMYTYLFGILPSKTPSRTWKLTHLAREMPRSWPMFALMLPALWWPLARWTIPPRREMVGEMLGRMGQVRSFFGRFSRVGGKLVCWQFWKMNECQPFFVWYVRKIADANCY